MPFIRVKLDNIGIIFPPTGIDFGTLVKSHGNRAINPSPGTGICSIRYLGPLLVQSHRSQSIICCEPLRPFPLPFGVFAVPVLQYLPSLLLLFVAPIIIDQFCIRLWPLALFAHKSIIAKRFNVATANLNTARAISPGLIACAAPMIALVAKCFLIPRCEMCTLSVIRGIPKISTNKMKHCSFNEIFHFDKEPYRAFYVKSISCRLQQIVWNTRALSYDHWF